MRGHSASAASYTFASARNVTMIVGMIAVIAAVVVEFLGNLSR